MIHSKGKRYIDKDQLTDAGIILVTSEDPLSRAIMSITKQEFSSIGFYYKSSVSGSNRIQIVIVDVFGVKTPEWIKSGDTLDDLIHNPLIAQIAVKGLRDVIDGSGKINVEKTKELHTLFRSSIAEVTSISGEPSMREALAQIFGYRIEPAIHNNINTAVEMVNKVIQKMGKWDDIPQDNTITINKYELPEENKMDASAKVKLLEYFGSALHQYNVKNPGVSNKQIQSYIVPNKLFGDLYYIKLPEKNSLIKELALSEMIRHHRPYLTQAISTFVEMLLLDNEFFGIVLKGINETRSKQDNERLKTILKDVIDDHSVNKLVDWIGSGKINVSELKTFITETQSKYNNINSIISDRSSDVITRGLSDTDSVNINGIANLSDVNDEILLIRSTNEFNNALKDLYTSVSNAVQSVNKGDTICIELNSLIDTTNTLLKLSQSEYTPLSKPCENTSYQSIVSTSGYTKIPITLRSGEKVVIPLVNPNLEQYDREMLLEILEILDILPDSPESHKYDRLRSCIAKELSIR